MMKITEKLVLLLRRLSFFLGATVAVCALLHSNSAVAGESAATRPPVFDASPYFEAGYTTDYLTNHTFDWTSQYVGLSIPLKACGLIYLKAENAGRFGLSDQAFTLSYAYPFPFGVMTLNGSYASNPDFLAKSAVGLEWNGRLPDGFGYTLGAEQRQYEEATTDMYRLGVEKNAGEFRLAYTAILSSIEGSRGELAHRVQLQWISDLNNRLGVTCAFGIEPEMVYNNTLSSVKTRYIQLDGLYWLTRRVGIIAACWHGMEGEYYQRNGGQIGLRIIL